MSDSDKKYRTVTIYDASRRKHTSRTLKIADFKNEKALDKEINRIKEEQKEKNKLFKENKKTEQDEQMKNTVQQQLNNIDNFHLDKNTGNSCVILGSSKRGKTTMMIYLYNKFYSQDKDYISTLFSGNYHINAYNDSKNLIVGDGFNLSSEKYVKMEKYINSKTKNKYKFLNLFDDIIDLKYKKLVNDLILTYRNSNISTIMCLQYAYLLNKSNRANVNNILIFGCNSEEGKKDLIELYLKHYLLDMGLNTYSERVNYFDKVTSNYGFFYINCVKGVMTTHRILIN